MNKSVFSVVDTNILIDANRGLKVARDFLDNIDPICVSSITAMELIQGAIDKKSLQKIIDWMDNLHIIYMTEITQRLAQDLLQKYMLPIGINPLDCCIAATAIENRLVLYTRNVKHFEGIKELTCVVPY